MPLFRVLPPGTTVIARFSFGPVTRGQRGIVTAAGWGSWMPWRRPRYACTFLGGCRARASRFQIKPHEHGVSRNVLEDPWWFLTAGDVYARPRAKPTAQGDRNFVGKPGHRKNQRPTNTGLSCR